MASSSNTEPRKPVRGMRRVRSVALLAGLTGLVSVAMVPSQASAGVMAVKPALAPPTNINDQLASADDDLAGANKKVNAARKSLDDAKAKLPNAQTQLTAAQASVAASQKAAAAATVALNAAEKAVLSAQADVVKIEAEVAALRARIAMLARAVYTSGGGFEELRILLDSSDPAQFAERMASIKRVSRGNNQTLDQLAEATALLARKLTEMRKLQDVAQQRRNDAAKQVQLTAAALSRTAAAKATVDKLVAQQSVALKVAAGQRESVKAMYDALLAEQRKIARKAREERAREKARQQGGKNAGGHSGGSSGGNSGGGNSGANSGGGNSGGSSGGRLSWPTPGVSVGGRTGWRVHPVYGYRSCHTGDDIGAGAGTPIHAAAGGRVISVDYGGPYGNHTLISHGGGLSTMYAHQSRIVVRNGERVSRGEVIGYVGSTGWVTGPHLHFEVHVNGVPYEPMGWFGESKHRVSCWSG
ncbi:MAG: peptidoglycan DD-metalloendopeptidase family protein [Candidatus Nanopelagicales bacterium]